MTSTKTSSAHRCDTSESATVRPRRLEGSCSVTASRNPEANMKNFMPICLLFFISLCAHAAQNDKAIYAGGTIPTLSAGTVGLLDTTSSDRLVFKCPGNRLLIPYASIDSFQYTQPVARHLGVLPAIAVALIKKRERKHLFRISYHDENGVNQVVAFEVPKQVSNTFLAILKTRAGKACQVFWSPTCGAVR